RTRPSPGTRRTLPAPTSMAPAPRTRLPAGPPPGPDPVTPQQFHLAPSTLPPPPRPQHGPPHFPSASAHPHGTNTGTPLPRPRGRNGSAASPPSSVHLPPDERGDLELVHLRWVRGRLGGRRPTSRLLGLHVAPPDSNSGRRPP